MGLMNAELAERPSEPSAGTGPSRRLKEAVKFLLLWLALVVLRLPAGPFLNNECDVLPVARQAVDKGWLPNDWYLNLTGPYREAFNLLCGPFLSSGIGFFWGAFILRLLVYALLAYGFYALFRALRLRFSLMLLALALFVPHQSLVAGEWVVGGVEAKAFAYGFVLLSAAALLDRRYLPGFAFAGMAFSFHALLGAYSLFALVGALILNKGEYRGDWRAIAKSCWIFPVTGIFGVLALLGYLDVLHRGGGAAAARAYEIYVAFRNPHHTLPSHWPGRAWLFWVTCYSFLLAAVYLISRSPRRRFISAYALSSALFFLIGLGLFAFHRIPALRYYWFRLPDVLLPLAVSILVAFAVDDLITGKWRFSRLLENWKPGFSRTLVIIISLAVFLPALGDGVERISQVGKADESVQQILPMLSWIKGHTPKDAIFLIDPSFEEFYVYTERAQFVTVKHAPYEPADVLEWYKRVILCNGGRRPREKGFDIYPELKGHYYHLSAKALGEITGQYHIDYYLGRPARALPFRRVHSEGGYTLYRVGE